MDWNMASTDANAVKIYEILQVDSDGFQVVEPVRVEAENGESAVKQLEQVADGAESIRICLNGDVMNEMGVDYWQKRVRRR